MKIKIKLHPNSSQEKIKKINEKEFEIWLKEKPIENKANIKLIKLLKENFKREVKILSGLTSRIKIVEIKKMRYEFAPDIQKIAEEVSRLLFPYIKIERVKCFRSHGTSSKRTIARCHTIGKLIQKAMNVPSFYTLEFLNERFNKLKKEEQIKVIIHELMHIPTCFGGGFRHHDYVCNENIEKNYKKYCEYKLRINP